MDDELVALIEAESDGDGPEEDAAIDEVLAETRPTSISTQSVICSKKRFSTAAAARAWVSAHGMRHDKMDETETSFRFRQFDPNLCREGSFRNIDLTRGVQAVICHKKTAALELWPPMTFLTCLTPGDRRGGASFALDPEQERALKAGHIAKIQALAKRPVAPEDVLVRGMYLCNSQRDYYYSRFTRTALAEIAELLPGAPVMQAHQRTTLPMGTFFDARVKLIEQPSLPRRDSYWVEALYYLPNDPEGQALAKRIDLGVQREVSIGWRCLGADCSECGEPIVACEHIPGDVYGRGICEYQFSGILGVLEGSFVYRGGQKDTDTFVPEGAAESPGAKARARLAWEERVASWAEVATFKRHGGERSMGFFGKPGDRRNMQGIVCARERFATVAAAARWVRDHDFRADRRRLSDNAFGFEQFSESLAEPDSFSDRKLDEGVIGRICKRLQKSDGRATVSLEQWFNQPRGGA